MAEYDPELAITDQAADAMSDAVSLCKSAGWDADDVEGMVRHFFEVNYAATPKEQSDG